MATHRAPIPLFNPHDPLPPCQCRWSLGSAGSPCDRRARRTSVGRGAAPTMVKEAEGGARHAAWDWGGLGNRAALLPPHRGLVGLKKRPSRGKRGGPLPSVVARHPAGCNDKDTLCGGWCGYKPRCSSNVHLLYHPHHPPTRQVVGLGKSWGCQCIHPPPRAPHTLVRHRGRQPPPPLPHRRAGRASPHLPTNSRHCGPRCPTPLPRYPALAASVVLGSPSLGGGGGGSPSASSAGPARARRRAAPGGRGPGRG